MAKESMKARERKREKMVAKYAAKREALKKAGDYEAIEKRIQMIYSNHDQYLDFARIGKKRSEEFYSSDRYYERLMLAVSD